MSRLFARLREVLGATGAARLSAQAGPKERTSEWATHGIKFVKYACIVYVVREHVCELSLVRMLVQCLCPVPLQPSCTSVGACAQCVGPSMLPTFNRSGDIVLFEHLSVVAKAVQPGGLGLSRQLSTRGTG